MANWIRHVSAAALALVGWFFLPGTALNVLRAESPALLNLGLLVAALAAIIAGFWLVRRGRGRLLVSGAALFVAVSAHLFIMLGPPFVLTMTTQNGVCPDELGIGPDASRLHRVPRKPGWAVGFHWLKAKDLDLTLRRRRPAGIEDVYFSYLVGVSELQRVTLDGCHVRSVEPVPLL